MKNFLQIILQLVPLFLFTSLGAQVTPSIEWQKCLGGNAYEHASSIQQTTDNGFIVAGWAYSNDGDVSGNHGSEDYWVVKLDASGNISWQKCLGGSGTDEAFSIQQISDGGFIVAGYTGSFNGEVTGNHGVDDYWIVRLSSTGNIVWQKALGASNTDASYCVQQTTDAGFIIAGYASYNSGNVTGLHGGADYWIVKLDSGGNLIWQKCLGGSANDQANSIQQTTNGGFIIAGYSNSNDDDVSGNHGNVDYWVVKTDDVGNISWQKSFGGSNQDYANSVEQTSDGGFIIAGYSNSSDGDVTENHLDSSGVSTSDCWILKLDTFGNISWQRSLGGSGFDQASSVQQTIDGGFIIAGYSNSNDGNVSGNHGLTDYWIVKLDAAGNLVWQKSLGGNEPDYGTSIQQISGGGFIIAGLSSSNDGDVSGNHGSAGNADYWIVKLSSDTTTGIASVSNNFISVYPNPVQSQLTINLATPAGESIIRVYDLQGKLISVPISFLRGGAKLDVENLSDGFYILQITDEKTGKITVGKFVKQ